MGSSEVKSTADFRTLEKIANEIRNRRRLGENTDLEQYVQQYPELADEIREALPALLILDELAPGPARNIADTPEFLHEEIGEYQILKELGRGGMGIVFHAVQKSLGRPVALKILPHAALLDKNGKERFQREAQIAAMLHHTNIVPVFAIGDWRGVPYYAMQYIEGITLDRLLPALRSLSEHIDPQGYPRPSLPLSDDPAVRAAGFLLDGRLDAGETKGDSVKRSTLSTHKTESVYPSDSSGIRPPYCAAVARLGVQIANALAHAHAHGVLHRDIKPSNLILGEDATLWVMDFGLAKQGAESDLTATGDLVGTLRYLAPERLRGSADERSDLYALGLTLYELLTFRPAFSDEDRGSLLARISRSDPVPLLSIHPWIPLDLVTIVTKAIAKEPDRRYASARDLSDDLIRFLEGRPVTARRTGALERTTRWCRRNPLIASLAASLFLALTAGLAGVTWQWRRAEANLTLAVELRNKAELNLREAEKQRLRAEENFRHARNSVDEYMTAISESTLLEVPTLEPLRKDLLERARNYYEEFLSQHDTDPALQAEIAAMHVRLANIIHDTDGAGWLPEIKKAIDILEPLADRNVPFDQFESWRHGVHNPRAGLLKTNHPEEALETVQRGIPIWNKLVQQYPQIHGFKSDLAGLHQVIGMLHRNLERSEAALDAFETARALRSELLEANPDSERFRYALAESYAILGLQHLSRNELNQAIDCSNQARDLFREVLQSSPGAARIENLLAATNQVLATEYLRKGEPILALSSFNEAIAIQEKLARDYPAARDFQTQLGWSYQQLGLALCNAELIAQGIDQYQKAIGHFESRVKDYPDEPVYLKSLANAHLELSKRLHAQQRIDDAVRETQKAAEVYREALGPQHPNVAACLSRGAQIFLKANQLENAQNAYQAALEAYGDPTPGTRGSIAAVHSWLGRIYFEQGRFDLSLKENQRAIDLWSQIRNARAKVAYSRYRLGRNLHALKDYEAAAKEYTAAVEIYREIGQGEGAQPETVLHWHGRMLREAGDWQAADELFAADRKFRSNELGTIFGDRWQVRFYVAPEDGDPLQQDIWEAATSSAPNATIETNALDFYWGGTAPHADVPPERFLLSAETTIELPEREYMLHLVADDCGRVYQDDEILLDGMRNPPGSSLRQRIKPDRGIVNLRVEYFQRTGHSRLAVWLKPMKE